MSNKIKEYFIEDGWLNIHFKGLLNKKQVNIDLRHISLVQYKKQIIKWLFILGILTTLAGLAFLIMWFDITYTTILIVGVLLILAGVLFGKKGITINTDSMRTINLPGKTEEEYKQFLGEIVK